MPPMGQQGIRMDEDDDDDVLQFIIGLAFKCMTSIHSSQFNNYEDKICLTAV